MRGGESSWRRRDPEGGKVDKTIKENLFLVLLIENVRFHANRIKNMPSEAQY